LLKALSQIDKVISLSPDEIRSATPNSSEGTITEAKDQVIAGKLCYTSLQLNRLACPGRRVT
jgi:hypothetical protein